MTKFWWLNESKTWKEGLKLGAAWAPLIDSGGGKPAHWERLDEVKVNDVVFHYVRGQIRAVSRVLAPANRATNPYRTKNWQDMGRMLRLTYEQLPVAVPLQAIPMNLRNVGETGSPFEKDGGVIQGYLFALKVDLALWLMETTGRAESDDEGLRDPGDAEAEATDETVIVQRPDGTTTTKTRGEHNQLVKHLFHNKTHALCAMCGRHLPVSLLVTAHIKQRAKATAAQRVDSNIVMSACVLGCDELYERGYIFLNKSGILKSDMLGMSEALDESLKRLIGRKPAVFSDATRSYFTWHRTHRRARSSGGKLTG